MAHRRTKTTQRQIDRQRMADCLQGRSEKLWMNVQKEYRRESRLDPCRSSHMYSFIETGISGVEESVGKMAVSSRLIVTTNQFSS